MTTFNIVKSGNYGVITPLPTGVLARTLLKYMSYTKQGAEFMPRPEWAVVKLYNINKGKFPWGMRDLVHQIFKKYCQEIDKNSTFNEGFINCVNFIDNKIYPLSFESLRPYQKDAVMKLLNSNGGIICMPTGAGKTKTIIEYLKMVRGNTIVIVPTLDIMNQWRKYTGEYVKVLNYQNKLSREYAKTADIIIFDECHHVSAKTLYSIAMVAKTSSIIIGCSATPTREDGEEMKIEAGIGKIIYNISKRELIEKGFLSDAKVFYFKPRYDTHDDKFLTYDEIYKKHVIDNRWRNDIIIEQAHKYLLLGKKVLILVSQIKHGEYLFNKILTNNKIYLHGSSKKIDREQDLSKFPIIVASNIFNEGVDLPSLDVIILASGGKSSILLTQRIGRVLRPSLNKSYALILDFRDEVKYLVEHYKKRRLMLESDFKTEDVI